MDYLKKLRRDEAEALSHIEKVKVLKAGAAMVKPVFLRPDDTADAILNKLKREDTNVCIVVDDERRFLGEISVEDIIRLFLHQVKNEPVTKILNVGYRRGFLYKKAENLMKKHKHSVKTGTPINRVIELVHKTGFDYIPVLDNDKKVLGVVTPSSVLALLQKH